MEIVDHHPDNGRGKYPWGTWLDGQTRRATRGTDFTVEPETFRQMVHARAKRRGLKAKVTVIGDEVTFTAFKEIRKNDRSHDAQDSGGPPPQ